MNRGPVAQLVERLTHNQLVGGSSPSGPIFYVSGLVLLNLLLEEVLGISAASGYPETSGWFSPILTSSRIRCNFIFCIERREIRVALSVLFYGRLDGRSIRYK